jgi:hypothetical protein
MEKTIDLHQNRLIRNILIIIFRAPIAIEGYKAFHDVVSKNHRILPSVHVVPVVSSEFDVHVKTS